MGIFDSSSSSTNRTESTDIDTTITTDIQRDQGFQDTSGLFTNAGDFNKTFIDVETLDGGAINSAFDFAKESQAYFGENFDSVLGLVERTNENANDYSLAGQRNIARAFTDQKAIEATSGISKVLPVISGAVIIGGIVFAIRALKG